MSLKPIINDSNALDNKSLNIYANSVTANDFIGLGTIVDPNIICETIACSVVGEFTGDFIASGNTCSLRGGNMPSSTATTAGWLLTNTDGLGNLQWTDASALFPSTDFPSSGNTTQTLTVAGAGSAISPNVSFLYILVGDIMTFSGEFAIDTSATGDFIEIDVSLPLGKKPVALNTHITCSGGVGTKDDPTTNVIGINSGTGVSANNLGITLSPVQGTTFTAKTGIICSFSGTAQVVNI
jgi:hypothetical protein